ncbi:hypothetical protein HBH71_005070 [Parastagonospora nodorum]|nr:hypothetical protein HBH71_005070 [Parastagonospora nodorum]
MFLTLNTTYPNNKYEGCFEDAVGGTGARLLDGPSFNGSSSLTQQSCKSFCTRKSTAAPAAPYRYFGTENGQDCRCGNSYKHSRATKTCRTACKGNNKQACGGTNAINVWVNQDFVAGGTSTKKPSVNSYPTQGAGENRPPMWVGDGVDEPYFPDDSKYWEGQEPAPADKPKPTSGTKPRPGNAGYPANSKPSPKPASGYKATKPSGYPATPAKRWLSRFNLWQRFTLIW